MPAQSALPFTLPVWLAAFSPILLLVLLLVWRRWPTSAAAPVAAATLALHLLV